MGEQPPTSNGYTYNLRFAGQYADAETGLIHNGFRDYCPGCGRYAQSDPVGMFGGQSSTYAYVGGNPIDRIDPLGLWQLTITVTLDGAVGPGGTLTFGYNSGQFNLGGGWLGASAGDSFAINPNNLPCHEPGSFRSTRADGKLGVEGGLFSTSFTTLYVPGVNSTEFTSGVPFVKPLETGFSIENGEVSSEPVVNIVGGESVFLGYGGQKYW